MTLDDLTHEIFRTARFGPAACRDLARALLAEKRRAVRKARGRTVGWLFLYRDERRTAGLGRAIHTVHDRLPKPVTGSNKGKDVARVVAVRRRKK